MDKRIVFSTSDGLGHHFAESIDISPRHQGLTKVAGAMDPAVAAFVKTLKSDPRYQYVLMTPMGSFETWGMNVNGDAFPECILKYDHTKDDPLPAIKELVRKYLSPLGEDLPPGNYHEFGYKTFLDANRYLHHANKNPEVSYGDVVFAAWNPTMHRVEIIVRHDRERAKKVGAEEVIKDIDEGRPRQLSMGCKTPFDWCSICGKVSRTTSDYCDHLKYQMGSTLPDGRAVCAINPFPRFFDVSDVFVPAAKESGTLMKVASAGLAKRATQQKLATIEKEVSPNTSSRGLSSMCGSEATLPMKALMDRTDDPALLLTTLAALGIVAKPEEFQYAMLCRMGKRDMADKLMSDRKVFAQGPPSTGANFDADSYSPDLARILSAFLPDRSAFYPHLPARVMRISVLRAAPGEPLSEVSGSEPLKKIASAYSSYRGALRDLPNLVELALARDADYFSDHFFRDLVSDSLTKTASMHGARSGTPLVPLYIYSAYRDGVSSVPESWTSSISPFSPVRSLFGPSF